MPLFSSKSDPLFARRTLARGIDSLICYAAGFPLGFYVYLAVFEYEDQAGLVSSETGASILYVVCTLIVLAAVHMLYEGLLLSLFSTTPGKAFAGLRVANAETGGKPAPGKAFARAYAVLNSGLFWYFLYPVPLIISWRISLRRSQQPWDRVTGTKVILSRKN